MAQQPDMIQQITDYLRREGSRPLDELGVLLDAVAADWQRCLEAMTEAQACFHPPEGPVPTTPGSGEGQKWSAKEVIGHFMFSERSLNQRIAELAGLPAPLTQVPRVRAMGEQSAEDERQTIDELRRRLEIASSMTPGLCCRRWSPWACRTARSLILCSGRSR